MPWLKSSAQNKTAKLPRVSFVRGLRTSLGFPPSMLTHQHAAHYQHAQNPPFFFLRPSSRHIVMWSMSCEMKSKKQRETGRGSQEHDQSASEICCLESAPCRGAGPPKMLPDKAMCKRAIRYIYIEIHFSSLGCITCRCTMPVIHLSWRRDRHHPGNGLPPATEI